MKKKNGMLILVGILAVLLILYFALRLWNDRQEEKKAEQEEADAVYVTDTDPEEITSIVYNVGNGDMSFQKGGDTWYYSQDTDFPLNQSYPESMAEALGKMKADRELTGGDSLADYGLDVPSYTVEYTDSDGSVTTLYFGDTTGDCYYVTVNDDETVFTVPNTVISDLEYSLDDMAQLDEYPNIGSGNLIKEVITRNGETTTYDSEDDDQQEEIAAVAGGLGAVTLSEAADYSVADEDLAGFGLDEASRITVEATYTEDGEENLLTLYIGGEDGSGNRYMMINESKIVYLISDEICGNILNDDED